MAGGVAYNSVANGRILRETGFEELYVQPSAGDSGVHACPAASSKASSHDSIFPA